MKTIFLLAKIACLTFIAAVIIFITDHLPQGLRRKLLSSEYAGQDLEDRLAVQIFAGWPTVKAIHHMLSINMRPQVQIGQPVRNLQVLKLQSQEEVALTSLTTSPTRPLVLNFGSCT